MSSRATQLARLPDAVLAHERLVRVPVPERCGKCNANAAQLIDIGGAVRCLTCGWRFLYLRVAAWLTEPQVVVPIRRGRARGWDRPAGA